MKSIDLYNSLHAIDDNILERSEAAIFKGKKTSASRKWAAIAACLCLVAATTFLGLDAYASNNNEAYLEVDTVPPNGLSLAIIDATPDDAEFLITNKTEFQVDYGYANRVEKYDGTDWVTVTTESAGIFPATKVEVSPATQMYGMAGWVSKRLILEPGTYRYLLVVNVRDTDIGAYPVVLKAEFEIQ